MLPVLPRYPPGDAGHQLVGDGAGTGRHLINTNCAPPEFDSVALLRIRSIGEINRQHIHGYPTDEPDPLSIDRRRCVGARMPGITFPLAPVGC